jgi:uncharacterized protein (TIGR02217 family)
MADIGVFPQLAGQGWSVTKTPTFQTRIQRAVSGRELRALDYPYPLWQFALTYEALGDGTGAGQAAPAIGSLLSTDLRTLMGFFMACQGAFATFLYEDSSDNRVTRQVIGTGAAGVTSFQLVRTLGAPGSIGFTEPIVAPGVVFHVYVDGVVQPPSSWSLDPATGIVTFTGAPLPETVITADFTYYFRCRFMCDAYSFENFMYRLWSLKKLDFISVIA